jgi:hypothetical protein
MGDFRRSRLLARRSALGTLVSTFVAVLAGATSPALAATVDVDCSSMNLQNKINAATGGSTLLITGTCVGNFTVDKNLTLRGNPSATLDGNHAGTTLSIPNTHTVHLVALTITHGSAATGAGISRPLGGVLTLNRVTVRDNVASGTTFALGGGIEGGQGTLTLNASRVVNNRAVASGGATADAVGGGISSGELTLIGSTVSFNRAVAKSTSGDAMVLGGGVFGSGPFSASSSHLDGNRATAIGPGAADAIGGATHWDAEGHGELGIENSTVSGNVITARATGSADAAAAGGGVWARFDTAVISGSSLANDHVTAISADGDARAIGGAIHGIGTTLTLIGTHVAGLSPTGDKPNVHAIGKTSATAEGGGITSDADDLRIRSSWISTSSLVAESLSGPTVAFGGGIDQDGRLSLSRSTVDQNFVFTGSAASSTLAVAGGIRVTSRATILASTISRNGVHVGGHGSANGSGGGLFAGPGTTRITNSTFVRNSASARVDTGSATATGGAVFTPADSSVLLTNTTLAGNSVGGFGDTETFQGGGLFIGGGTTTFKATVLALNDAVTGPNCFGSVQSQGHNLLGKTAGCTFASKPSDKLHLDPKLGSLADNGGPTRTMALLAGSPALDVIPPAACAVATDQRGVHRPQGPRCDIGSFERKL